MVDCLACEVIGAGIVNVTCRDGTVRVLEAVWYVSEALYNLISIGLLDEKRCWMKVLQSVVMVSQRDWVILKEKKFG